MNQVRTHKSFALLSPCGHGNLGDAAIQMAVLQNIRSRIPDATFYGITMNPRDTEKRHGIPTYPIGAVSRPGYAIYHKDEFQCRGDEDSSVHPCPRSVQNVAGRAKKSILRLITNAARLALPRGVPWAVRSEKNHITGCITLLRNVDLLIISGGGQLDDFWGNAWGHPYALFKWSILAFLMRKRVVALSVGYGSLDSRISRFFVRTALGLADYISYRDDGSKNLMRMAGFRRNGPVFPDLAFSLEVYEGLNRGASLGKLTKRVCISPMAYCDPRVWPRKSQVIFSTYLNKLADIAVSLIRRNYTVVLLPTDGADKLVVAEIKNVIISRLAGENVYNLEVPVIDTVDDFLGQVSRTDVAIASRMHGVLLSFLMITPVIALSYDRKVRDLMTSMEQKRYCLDVDSFVPEEVLELLDEQEKDLRSIQMGIEPKLRLFHQALFEQYDAMLMSTARISTQ